MNNYLATIKSNKQLIDVQVARFQGAASALPPAIGDDTLLNVVMAADLVRVSEDLRSLEPAAAQLEAPAAVPQIEHGSASADPRPTP